MRLAPQCFVTHTTLCSSQKFGPNALFAGFLLLLGDFNANEFTASLSPFATMILFVVFMVFINIIMLNLLIAIMGDIFDR